MKKLKFLAVTILVMSVAACGGQQKVAEAQKVEPVVSSPEPSPETASKMTTLKGSNEFIFSSDTKTSEDKLKTVFKNSGITSVKPLGGEQYFLKFSGNKEESDLLTMLKENGLAGSVSRNLRYQAPPPKGGKYQLKDKLKQ